MKVYLENGYGGMRASLFIYPQKLEHHSRTDNPIPEVVRNPLQAHIIRIIGKTDQVIDIEGSLPELKKFGKSMSEILDNVKE